MTDQGHDAVMKMLQNVCATFVMTIEFDGGGDSGQIGEIAAHGLLDEKQLEAVLVPDAVKALFSSATPHISTENVAAFMKDYAYTLLDECLTFDWVNNYGGNGTITIEPFTGKVTVVANENMTVSREHTYTYTMAPRDVLSHEVGELEVNG